MKLDYNIGHVLSYTVPRLVLQRFFPISDPEKVHFCKWLRFQKQTFDLRTSQNFMQDRLLNRSIRSLEGFPLKPGSCLVRTQGSKSAILTQADPEDEDGTITSVIQKYEE